MPGSIIKTFFGGSRRSRSRAKTLRGGCMSIGAAILPFGLLGLQKYIQTRKRHPAQYKKNGKWRRMRNTKRRSDRIKLADDSI